MPRSESADLCRCRREPSGRGIRHGQPDRVFFSRGAKGFVAIHNDTATWNASLATGLPAGTYCNVVHRALNTAKTGCTGDSVVVAANGVAAISLGSVTGATVPSVALHINQKIASPTCATVSVKLRLANANTVMGQNVYATGNRTELGNWTATSAGLLTIEGTGANAAWSRTFSLPPSTAIQYKFLKHGTGADVWESNQSTASGNREAVTPACGAATLVLDAGNF